MKLTLPKLAFVLLAGLAVVCFLPATVVTPTPTIARPELHWGNAEERQQSLEAMRQAWLKRDRSNTPENGIEERRYIFRLNFFTRYVRDTETFHDASAFLVTAYWENAALYGEINRH